MQGASAYAWFCVTSTVELLHPIRWTCWRMSCGPICGLADTRGPDFRYKTKDNDSVTSNAANALQPLIDRRTIIVIFINIRIILVNLGDFGQIPGPSSSLFGGRAAAAGCVFLHIISHRGKLLKHKSILLQCYKKSTRVPVSPVPQYGYSV
jgi:hypothetical protein